MPNIKTSRSVEDYLKAIYHRGGDRDSVSTTSIAHDLGVSSPSVTGMFKKLVVSRLIHYSRYSGARLTKEGKKRAVRLIRRHRLLELFLQRCLKMSWDAVHQEAEALEHVLSDQLEQKIDQWLGAPKFDPHGSPIPDLDGRFTARTTFPLVDAEINVPVTIAEITSQGSELLAYLSRRRLLPNQRITIKEKDTAGAVIKIKLSGKTVYVGTAAAEFIMVQHVN
jgi:DtxR family Mn-dependent transcriptional regulator